MRPKEDDDKTVKETPIPPEHVSTCLPLWDQISTIMTSVKKNVDKVSSALTKANPSGLSAAGAASASLRVGKLLKVCKGRDLGKALNGVSPAVVKTNLAWAGMENQRNDKSVQVSSCLPDNQPDCQPVRGPCFVVCFPFFLSFQLTLSPLFLLFSLFSFSFFLLLVFFLLLLLLLRLLPFLLPSFSSFSSFCSFCSLLLFLRPFFCVGPHPGCGGVCCAA